MFGSRTVTILALTLLSVVFLSSAPIAHATVTDLSMPDISVCLGVGSTVTAALTASSVTNVVGWQANITYSNLAVKNVTLGSLWNNNSVFVFVNANGSLLSGFAFYNNKTLTQATSLTMLTITFTILYQSSTSLFHIVLASEDPYGIKLVNTDLSKQSYTATDGSLNNCSDAPAPRAASRFSPAENSTISSAPPQTEPQQTEPPGSWGSVCAMELSCGSNYSEAIVFLLPATFTLKVNQTYGTGTSGIPGQKEDRGNTGPAGPQGVAGQQGPKSDADLFSSGIAYLPTAVGLAATGLLSLVTLSMKRKRKKLNA